eukprot:564840-Alexandrium_andersonii.AAC.1
MSASLVGSEMCIRDSLLPAVRPLVVPPAPAVPALPTARARLPPATLPPVSYTHLTLPTICSV